MNKPYFCRNFFLTNTIDLSLFYGEHFYGFSESDMGQTQVVSILVSMQFVTVRVGHTAKAS